jgi:cobalt-zinc-cadmium efflux system outer membrane protein
MFPRRAWTAVLVALGLMMAWQDAAHSQIPEMVETPASPLTLEQLEQWALASNPTLAQAVADVDTASGRAIQAGIPPNPTVGYTGQQIGSQGTAGQQGIYLEQPVIRGQ